MIRFAGLGAALVVAALALGPRFAEAQVASSTRPVGDGGDGGDGDGDDGDDGDDGNAGDDGNDGVAAPATRAAPPATAAATATSGARPRILAVATAAVPGFFYSGLGVRAAGDAATGRRLARLHSASLGVLVAGALPFAVTGASRRTSGYAMPLMLLGTGGFFTTWWADIYGAATGGRRARARTDLPDLEVELGYLYVVDPRFDYGHFLAASAVWRAGRWASSGRALVAADDPTQRFEVAGAYRWFGPSPGGGYALGRGDDGSFVDVELGAIAHRQPGDGFSVYTPTLSARGRLDMARVGPALSGAFVDLSVGFGVELYDFAGVDGVTEVGLQLARFGFGLYLGEPGRRYGEVRAYYDHRHDELAAGLGTGLQFDGPWGHLGLSGFLYLTERWGISAEAEIGAAYVTRLSARFAWGRP